MNAHWNLALTQNVLKSVLGLASPSFPSAWYLALSDQSADPNLGVWSELTIANYSRKSITWAYGGDVYGTNSNQIDFANLGAGSVLGQRIYDASSSGNLLFWADLDLGFSFVTGHTISYGPGLIRIGAIL